MLGTTDSASLSIPIFSALWKWNGNEMETEMEWEWNRNGIGME
jgi:hypothetical protein